MFVIIVKHNVGAHYTDINCNGFQFNWNHCRSECAFTRIHRGNCLFSLSINKFSLKVKKIGNGKSIDSNININSDAQNVHRSIFNFCFMRDALLMINIIGLKIYASKEKKYRTPFLCISHSMPNEKFTNKNKETMSKGCPMAFACSQCLICSFNLYSCVYGIYVVLCYIHHSADSKICVLFLSYIIEYNKLVYTNSIPYSIYVINWIIIN